MDCSFWDQLATKIQLWAGGGSRRLAIYNGGLAHKGLTHDPKPVHHMSTPTAPRSPPQVRRCGARSAFLPADHGDAGAAGQREAWWYAREFETRDHQFRQRFKRAA
jgi:hypothetical protein